MRLNSLSAEKPTTKMGQIRWAWPEIQSALAAGHTLQVVHRRLGEAGIEIDYRTLSLYIGRLEREQDVRRTDRVAAQTQGEKEEPVDASPATGAMESAASQAGQDPFANIRREREKKKGLRFEYDAFSINKNLLE